MKRKAVVFLLSLLLVAALALPAAGGRGHMYLNIKAAQGTQEVQGRWTFSPDTPGFEVKGVVSAVDAAGGTLTVSLGAGLYLTVQVTAETKIEVNGDDDKTLADIVVDMVVEAEGHVDGELLVAKKIEAEADDKDEDDDEVKLKGAITAVDAANMTLTVAISETKTRTVKITDGTKIKVAGDDEEFGDLAVGMFVEVEGWVKGELVVAKKIKIEVREDSNKDADDDDDDEIELKGTITAVDGGNKTLTVTVRSSIAKTVKVTDGTEIEIDDNDGKAFGDLTVGMTVEVEGHMDNGTIVAEEIEAKNP